MRAAMIGLRPEPTAHPRYKRAFLTCLFLVGACVRQDASGPVVSRTDSAGVSIIDFRREELDDVVWISRAEPSLVLGADETRPFHEVMGAVRLPTGAIAVLDAGARQLAFFDSTGGFLRTAGGGGEGPGEFLTPVSLVPSPGGSLLVFDASLRRVTEFSVDGELMRTFTLPPAAGGSMAQTIEAVLSDGSLVAKAAVPGSASLSHGLTRWSADVLLFPDRGQKEPRRIGSFPGKERFFSVSASGFQLLSPIFGRDLFIAGGHSLVYAGTNDRFSIQGFSQNGRLVRTIRARGGVETDLRQLAQVIEQRVRGVDRARRPVLRRTLESMPVPDTVPAFSAIVVDETDRLWVRPFSAGIQEQGEVEWIVFDADGVPIGLAKLPAPFEPYQIGEHFVLGRWRDRLGVEQIRLYALDPPPR